MSVSLMIGLGLLAVLVLLVLALLVIVMMSGRSPKQAPVAIPSGQVASVNVFQRGVPELAPTAPPVPVFRPAPSDDWDPDGLPDPFQVAASVTQSPWRQPKGAHRAHKN
jgi:hypothetical protein